MAVAGNAMRPDRSSFLRPGHTLFPRPNLTCHRRILSAHRCCITFNVLHDHRQPSFQSTFVLESETSSASLQQHESFSPPLSSQPLAQLQTSLPRKPLLMISDQRQGVDYAYSFLNPEPIKLYSLSHIQSLCIHLETVPSCGQSADSIVHHPRPCQY
ncbi:hypothetical protein LZ32DRAFT_75156 [Colletotrichum eremochloae]|nr:hypothetical protein LZ32DRAFT_75156 [Colletotrichum eremochloae]